MRCERCSNPIPRGQSHTHYGFRICPTCAGALQAQQPPTAAQAPATPAPTAASLPVREHGPLPPPRPKVVEPPTGGSEVSLDRWRIFFLVVGVVDAIGAVISGLAWFAGDEAAMVLFVITFAGALSSFFFAALLRGAGDVVRLLKRSNGLPYGGEL